MPLTSVVRSEQKSGTRGAAECVTDVTSLLKLFLILYCIKQIDSKLLCVCSVIHHRGRQNVVRTSVTHSAAPCVPLFCSYHILTSSVIYY